MSVASSYSLRSYVLKRVLQSVPLVLSVIALNFVVIHLAPGNPIVFLAGDVGAANPEFVKVLTTQYGLDKPLYTQFLIYMSNLFGGNFGYSIIYNQPVIDLILSRLPYTILLMSLAITVATLLGVLLGVFSSKRPFSIWDNIAVLGALIGFSLPVFWLGQMMLVFFSLDLRLFPVEGAFSATNPQGGIVAWGDLLWHVALPATALAVQYLAVIARVSRASMLEQLRQDYITTARSKGLPESTVFYKHALRNGLIPVVSIAGIYFAYMLGGAVVTETVFGWPGIGRLLYDASFQRDYPVILGVFVFVAISTVVVNLVVDVAYAKLDPRVRFA